MPSAQADTQTTNTLAAYLAARTPRRRMRHAFDGWKRRAKALTHKFDPTGNWIRTVYYHHIFDDERRGFAEQLRFMRQHGEFLSFDAAAKMLNDGTPIDGRYFCVSFDDGFTNCWSNGGPILAEFGAPAIYFVISDFVNQASCGDAPQYPSETEHDIPIAYLTWAQLREMIGAGMAIGSHSVSHRRLARLPDDQAHIEIGKSKRDIESHLESPCVHFCCPWGKPDRDFRPGRDDVTARVSGYQSFSTTVAGPMLDGFSTDTFYRNALFAWDGAATLPYMLGRCSQQWIDQHGDNAGRACS